MPQAAGAFLDDQQTDRRWRLKAATAEAHTRVEDQLAVAGMLSSPEGYRRYLEATFEIRSAIEREMDLAHAVRIMPLWPERKIAPLVAMDIMDVGGWVQAPKSVDDAPADQSIEAILGVLYVLEGSSLGARVVLKQVEALGMSHQHGARHLSAQAGDNKAWRQLTSILQHDPMSALGEAACIRAAQQTFERFGDAYRRHGVK
jgi:heme oxygenase